MSGWPADIERKATALIALCSARGLMVATAESCTGGLIAGALTEIAGSSSVVDRGFVTYSNDAKMQMLGVDPATLAAHGAVSRQTAIELCARLGIPLRLTSLPAAAVRDADEVFLTSTGGGILPIARIDGRPLPRFPGPVTTRLHDAYWAIHEEPQYRDAIDYGP